MHSPKSNTGTIASSIASESDRGERGPASAPSDSSLHCPEWPALLCRTVKGEEKTLLVVPRAKTEIVMELAHAHPMADHLGGQNTTQRVRDRFHWPSLEADVKRFCQACLTCQRTSPQTPPPSPLIPLPIIEVPFERIGMDLIGPLPKSARGHILVIVDYATRYLEAVPLRKAIAQELFLLSSRVGIPAEILTDQGTPFMSRLMADLCRLLKVKQLRTTVYHPQTDGLVEQFNQTPNAPLRGRRRQTR